MSTLTDKMFQQLTQSIGKAINSLETPVKEKHVRSTIIGTFHEKGAVTYWVVALRLPLQDNRIVAWKFCHVTHKLLREGHPACLTDSSRHISAIQDLGNLWKHLKEGYGKLILLYCNLLVTKLQFHAHNPRFPGNLSLTAEELDAIAENDVNNYFQLCVELFDYMDDILKLQTAVFDSLDNMRWTSMTSAGQCRLGALLACAQDSSQLYDCGVRLLFRLHASLPSDILTGHRTRFHDQFRKLAAFYKQLHNMQYFRNLLTVPQLPDKPPNFLMQSDFGTYVPPVMVVPEEPPEEVDPVGSLIDTSDAHSQVQLERSQVSLQAMTSPESYDTLDYRSTPSQDTRTTPSPQPDLLIERDRLIDHLQGELKRLRNENHSLASEKNHMLGSMRDHCTKLDVELNMARDQLQEEILKNEKLAIISPELEQKVNDAEGKAKMADEKFQKLKSAYTQMRDEHINLIRQKAEIDKAAANMRSTMVELQSTKVSLEQKLNESSREVDTLQQSASTADTINTELEAAQTELAQLRTELEKSNARDAELEAIKLSMATLSADHASALQGNEGKITALKAEVLDLENQVADLQNDKAKVDNELKCLQGDLEVERSRAGEDMSTLQVKLSSVDKELADLKVVYEQTVSEKDSIVAKLTADVEAQENEKKSLEERLNRNENERLTVECELQDLLQHNHSLEEELGKSKVEAQKAQEELQKYRAAIVESAARACLELITKSAADLDVSSSTEHAESAAKLASDSFLQLAARDKMEGAEAETARATIVGAHHAAQLAAHLANMAATLTDIDVADKLVVETRSTLESARVCVETVVAGRAPGRAATAAAERMRTLAASAAAAPRSAPSAATVDDELAQMDQAIEEATHRIEEIVAASKTSQSGVKLEVSGRILEACTALMGAVRMLVRAARALQAELGGAQRRARLYARNPQWSEGLISAAKSVVVAAKLLVSSADEAVEGSGALEAVAAASHEVAGSTAALVAASRARAPPASAALANLAAASRAVARATGAVVAVVRSAATLVADHEDLETTALTLTAARRLEMESKVRSLELETALDAERARLAMLRRRHYQLAQVDETGAGEITNGDH